MTKEFYTEKDIEDLAARGVMSLQVTENVVLTDLAYERAKALGVALVECADNPPAAPVRPYLSGGSPANSQALHSTENAAPLAAELEPKDLRERIRSAVNARLGNAVDPTVLETIINRVLAGTGIK